MPLDDTPELDSTGLGAMEAEGFAFDPAAFGLEGIVGEVEGGAVGQIDGPAYILMDEDGAGQGDSGGPIFANTGVFVPNDEPVSGADQYGNIIPLGFIPPQNLAGMNSPMSRIGGEFDVVPRDPAVKAMFEELSAKFPELRAKHDDIYRRFPGARKYLNWFADHTPKRVKWWFYVLGTDQAPSSNPDIVETIVPQAKHLERPMGSVVDHVTPEPILDSILGLGPKIMLDQAGFAPQTVSGVGFVDPVTMGVVASAVPKMTKFLGDAVGWIAKLFKLNKGPNMTVGVLGTRVVSPLLLLEVDFKGQPTGVPSRLTKDTMTGNVNLVQKIAQQADKAGQLSVQQAKVVETQAKAMGAQAGQQVVVNRQQLATAPMQAVTFAAPAQVQPQPMYYNTSLNTPPKGGDKEEKKDNTILYLALAAGAVYLLTQKKR